MGNDRTHPEVEAQIEKVNTTKIVKD